VSRRIIVCGGRDYVGNMPDFDRDMRPYRDATIVHGACTTGLDKMAAWWCKANAVKQEPHPADWSDGKRAGPIRNQQMADAGAEACLAWPGGKGTLDMKRRALAAGIRVIEMDADRRQKELT